VCHKDIRSNVITCSSNIEGFLKTLKGFLKTLKVSLNREVQKVQRFKVTILFLRRKVQS
jgi:hypothetical protein